MTLAPASLRQRFAEAKIALMLLTRLPAGAIGEPVPSTAEASWAFPFAGLVVGAVSALVLYGAHGLGLPAPLAAGLALAAGLVATGGLHEDGLADTADGFGGGKSAELALAIMRDSRIGSYGALALIMVVGMRWSAVAALATSDAPLAAAAIVAIAASSRAGLPAMLALLPPARSDGLGRAAAGPSTTRVLIAAAAGVMALLLLIDSMAGLAMAAAQAATLAAMAAYARRKIGGQTGDVLGAMQQASDLVAWITLAALAQ